MPKPLFDSIFLFMETLEEYVDAGTIITSLSVVFTILNVYLTLNKLWSRKHHRAVAESISIAGRLVAIIAVTILTINFILHEQWQGFINMTILITSEIVQIFVGTGYWVDAQRKKGFWRLFKDSLKLEKQESTDLAFSLFRPAAADRVIEILKEVAALDAHIDQREKEFVENFARNWNIKIDWSDFENLKTDSSHFQKLRGMLKNYLGSYPPAEQVTQLSDVINTLVKIDDDISPEEELMISELTAIMSTYINKTEIAVWYHVALIPQNEEQERYVRDRMPDKIKPKDLAGGKLYVLGHYHSLRYAEAMCEKYIDWDCVCIPVQSTGEEYRFFRPHRKKLEKVK